MGELREELLDFDGRDTQPLEDVVARLRPTVRRLEAAIDLAVDEDDDVAAGATWLLRRWLEAGAVLGAPQVRRLVALLPRVESDWARLHVAQSMRVLPVPAGVAGRFVVFFEGCLTSRRPFLRAWATDALHRVAKQHPVHAASARTALAAAHADPAASVRARARRIEAGD